MLPDCPALEELAAFVDGSASIDRLSVEAHLVNCEICRATVALGVLGAEDVPDQDVADKESRCDWQRVVPQSPEEFAFSPEANWLKSVISNRDTRQPSSKVPRL